MTSGKAPLKTQLCAVKIPSRKNQDTTAREIEVLKCFGLKAGPLAQRFPQFIDAVYVEEPLSSCRWLATTAIPGFNLEQLIEATGPDPVPNELVMHIYLQLGEAIRFMHDMELAHRDLHPGNIMLDPSKQDVPGFPNVVVIDFGSVKDEARREELVEERKRFYYVVSQLAMMYRKCRPVHHWASNVKDCACDPFWVDFVKVLNEPKPFLYPQDIVMGHVEFQSRFGARAVAIRDSVKPDTRYQIAKLIGKAMQSVKGVTEEEIRKSLVDAGFI